MKVEQLADIFNKSKTAGTQWVRLERSFKRAAMESDADDINTHGSNWVKTMFIQEDARFKQCSPWPFTHLSPKPDEIFFFFFLDQHAIFHKGKTFQFLNNKYPNITDEENIKDEEDL